MFGGINGPPVDFRRNSRFGSIGFPPCAACGVGTPAPLPAGSLKTVCFLAGFSLKSSPGSLRALYFYLFLFSRFFGGVNSPRFWFLFFLQRP
jgi:hypothetical protein